MKRKMKRMKYILIILIIKGRRRRRKVDKEIYQRLPIGKGAGVVQREGNINIQGRIRTRI